MNTAPYNEMLLELPQKVEIKKHSVAEILVLIMQNQITLLRSINKLTSDGSTKLRFPTTFLAKHMNAYPVEE